MVTVDDVRVALGAVGDWGGSAVSSVREFEEGVNDTFAVTVAGAAPADELVVKFATFSRPEAFRAGVAAYRLLAAYTALPVPAVHAVSFDAAELPPFYVAERLPGEPPEGPTDPLRPAPVREVGRAIDGFASIPSAAADGYGQIREWRDRDRTVRAEYDDFPAWFGEYVATLYEEPPAHDHLGRVAPDVPAFVRDNLDLLPSTPDPSVVVTDFGTGNLLVAGDRPARRTDGTPELTGVIDLERAKIGPPQFTAVNAEYLLTRGVDESDPLVDALYEPLPFGPDVPARELYWLAAMGRSVHSLELWYDPGSEQYVRRGNVIASTIERILR